MQLAALQKFEQAHFLCLQVYDLLFAINQSFHDMAQQVLNLDLPESAQRLGLSPFWAFFQKGFEPLQQRLESHLKGLTLLKQSELDSAPKKLIALKYHCEKLTQMRAALEEKRSQQLQTASQLQALVEAFSGPDPTWRFNVRRRKGAFQKARECAGQFGESLGEYREQRLKYNQECSKFNAEWREWQAQLHSEQRELLGLVVRFGSLVKANFYQLEDYLRPDLDLPETRLDSGHYEDALGTLSRLRHVVEHSSEDITAEQQKYVQRESLEMSRRQAQFLKQVTTAADSVLDFVRKLEKASSRLSASINETTERFSKTKRKSAGKVPEALGRCLDQFIETTRVLYSKYHAINVSLEENAAGLGKYMGEVNSKADSRMALRKGKTQLLREIEEYELKLKRLLAAAHEALGFFRKWIHFACTAYFKQFKNFNEWIIDLPMSRHEAVDPGKGGELFEEEKDELNVKGERLLEQAKGLEDPGEPSSPGQCESYSCGLEGRGKQRGSLALSKQFLFYCFGQEELIIPYKEVVESSALGKDAIEVSTNFGQLVFTHLKDQERVLESIRANTPASKGPATAFQSPQYFSAGQLQGIKERLERVKEGLPKDYNELIIQNKIKRERIETLFDVLYASREGRPQPMIKVMEDANNFDVSAESWQPAVASFREAFKNDLPCTRRMEYKANIPKIPFFPSFALTTQSQKLFAVSQDKFCIQTSVKMGGVPFSDSMRIELLLTYEQAGPDVKYRITAFVDLLQSSMLRGTIISESYKKMRLGSPLVFTSLMKFYQDNKPARLGRQVSMRSVKSEKVLEGEPEGGPEREPDQLEKVRSQLAALRARIKLHQTVFCIFLVVSVASLLFR